MRNIWFVGFLAVSLGACGGGDDDDDDDTFDAPAVFDADPTQPDADPTQPDADLTQPDAEPGTPDAPQGYPDAALTVDATPTPPPFSVTFAETCPAFTACGGAVQGLWFYTGVCITHDEVLAPIRDLCALATVLGGSGSGTGLTLFTATEVTRQVSADYTVTANVPSDCTMGLDCASVEGLMNGYGFTGTCAVSTSMTGCDCTVNDTLGQSGTGPYTAAGDTITTGSPSHTYEYCVTGGTTMGYRDVTSTSGVTPDPGLVSLQLQ